MKVQIPSNWKRASGRSSRFPRNETRVDGSSPWKPCFSILPLCQAANLFFAAAFLVPRSFKASVLALRTFLTAGFMLAALWAGITICALDAMLWCLALGLLNGIHSLILACRFLPPALSPELAELYLKLFKPYKVSKKHFQELAKEARILKLDSGQTYATEGVTPADERLSILLRGK